MLQVGDKVKIKSVAEIKKYDNRPGFFNLLHIYCGERAKIVKKYPNVPTELLHLGVEWVYLDIDDEKWVWSSNWLKKINNIKLNDDLFEL